MLRRHEDFVVNTNQKCIHIHCNGEFENGKGGLIPYNFRHNHIRYII